MMSVSQDQMFLIALSRVIRCLSAFAVCLGCASIISFTLTDQASAQTKSLKLYYTHTRERATITFKRNGKYDKRGLQKLNQFLRDWRRNEPTTMDPRLFDLVWEVYRKSGAKNYIHVVSAYRSPATNEMLRKTRGGQARKSQHMVGKAIDFYIPGVKTSKLREIAMKMQGGGVGYYPKSASPFVHLDVASVRAWPRMSRAQLVRLFPDGKTLHVPPDGKRLPGYAAALAEYKRKGRVQSRDVATSTKEPQRQQRKTAPKPEPAAPVFPPRPAAPDQSVIVASVPNQVNVAQALRSLDRSQVPVPFVSVPQNVPSLAEPVQVAGLSQNNEADLQSQITAFAANSNANPNLGIAPSDDGSDIPIPHFRDGEVFSVAENNAIEDSQVEVAALAYDAQPAKQRLSEMLAEAFEREQLRKQNSLAAVPAIAQIGQADNSNVELAALVPTPQLREHNRSGRVTTDAASVIGTPDQIGLPDVVIETLPALKRKARPNLRNALAAKRTSTQVAPKLTPVIISSITIDQNSVVTMKSPARAPKFVNRFMRQAPTSVYADGFDKTRRDQNYRAFSGSAVQFLTIAHFDG